MENRSSLCDVCTKTLTKGLNHVTHFEDGTPVCCDIIWNQNFCPQHLKDETSICCGCQRLKKSNVTYVDLGDGRKICPECYSTAIFDIGQCETQLIDKCHEFFDTLDMSLPEGVRVFLVDAKEMARLDDKPDEPNMVYGMRLGTNCKSESVVSCLREGNRVMVRKGERECCRNDIAILFGLPKIMTQAILAHEVMHVWILSNGVEFGELERKLVEGMCQVIGWKWLDWFMENEINYSLTSSQTTTASEYVQTRFMRKLVDMYKFVIRHHKSDVYGEGFRVVESEVARNGLKSTINRMINSINRPERLIGGNGLSELRVSEFCIRMQIVFRFRGNVTMPRDFACYFVFYVILVYLFVPFPLIN